MSLITTIDIPNKDGDLYLNVTGYSGCNIREYPSPTSNIVGAVKNHESIVVESIVGNYYKIDNGYVIRYYEDDDGIISWTNNKPTDIFRQFHRSSTINSVTNNNCFMLPLYHHKILTNNQINECLIGYSLNIQLDYEIIFSPYGIDAIKENTIWTYYNCFDFGCPSCCSSYKYTNDNNGDNGDDDDDVRNIDIYRRTLARTKMINENLGYNVITLWSNHINTTQHNTNIKIL